MIDEQTESGTLRAWGTGLPLYQATLLLDATLRHLRSLEPERSSTGVRPSPFFGFARIT